MPKSGKVSPARSQGAAAMPRRYKPRGTRSVGSPARSDASGRLSTVVDQFKEINKDSFTVSPLGKTVLNDDTDIEQPRRASWWKKVNNSRDVSEVLDSNKGAVHNVFEDLDIEVLSKEKMDFTMDLPESSDNESINSIVVPQRKLFTQKENLPLNQYRQIVQTRDTKQNKTNIADKSAPEVGPRNLFNNPSNRPRPIFPAALLNFSPDKTAANKTKALPAEVKCQTRNLFGNHQGTKRKTPHMFANFNLISSESEDDISDVEPKIFAFQKNTAPVRHSSVRGRETSPTSSMTADIEKDFLNLLPSSTMVEHQIEATVAITPAKRARLSMMSEAKESTVTNSSTNKTKQSNKSASMNHEKTNDVSFKQKGELNASFTVHKEMQEEQQDNIVTSEKILDKVQPIKDGENKEIETSLTEQANEKSEENEKDIEENIDEEMEICDENLEHPDNQEVEQIDEKMEDDQQSKESHREQESYRDRIKSNKIENKKQIVDAQKNDKNYEETYDNNQKVNKQKSKVEQEMENDHEGEEMVLRMEEDEEIEIDNEEIEQEIFDNEQQNESQEVHNESQEQEEIEYANEDIQDQSVNGDCIQNDEVENEENDNSVEKIQNESEEMEDDEEQDQETEKEVSDTEEPNECPEVQDRSREDQDERQQVQDASQEVQDQNQEVQDESQDIQDESQEVQDVSQEVEDGSQEIEDESQEVQDESQKIEDESQEVQDESQEVQNESEEVQNESQEVQDESQEVDDENQEIDDENQDILEQSEEENDDSGGHNKSQEVQDEIQEVDDENQDIVEQSEEENDDSGGHNKSQEVQDEIQEVDDENQDIVEQSEEENDGIGGHNESQEVQDESQEVDDENQDIVEQSEEENYDTGRHNERAEVENYYDEEIQNESQEEIENESQEDEDDYQEQDDDEQETEEQETEDNTTMPNTTGRNRKKDEIKSPEAILHNNVTNQTNSFTAKGRNTSIRDNKTILKIKHSLAPLTESTRLSDGTKNSSAEGSGWDSHRTTRKTLRQTFGRDFTPRKSLRAMVMEKSAKRQTAINEANAALNLQHQEDQEAGAMEMPSMGPENEIDYEENEVSDHEVSRRTRQTTLEMYLEKVKKECMERNHKIKEEVKNSLKLNPNRRDVLNRIPTKPIRRLDSKPFQSKSKKRQKPCIISLEDLPPELVEDMKYKPPKRYKACNASWITKRLYKFLETKLEPKYDYRARIRAEKLVETIHNFARDTRRKRVAPPGAVADLKREMARLRVVRTHFEFYNFFDDFMPLEVKIKVVPDIVNDLPLPRDGIFADILEEDE